MSIEGNAVQYHINNGHAALWAHDWSNAVLAYEQALIESPENPVAQASLGLALYHLKNYRESLRIFQKLSGQQPEDPMPVESIARIYEREGLLPEAAGSYGKAAHLQMKAHDVDRSLADYRSIIRLDPKNQEARARLAMILNRLGRKEESSTEFIDLAAVLQRAGEHERAQQVLEYTQQINPGSIAAINAISALRNGQSIPLRTAEESSAAARMAQVREIESAQSNAESQMGRDPLMEARLRALEDCASILFEDAGSAQPVTLPGKTNASTGLPDGSTGSSQPDNQKIHQHVSESIQLQSAGKNEDAAAELEQAIAAGLNLPAADYLIGLYTYEKDPKRAYAALQKTVGVKSFSLASYLLLGMIHTNTGQLKDSTSCYLHALMMADIQTVSPEKEEELMQLYEPIFDSQSQITQENDLRNLCTVIHNQLVRKNWLVYLKAAREQLPPQPETAPPMPLAEMLLETTSSQVVESLSEIRRLVRQGKTRSAMEESYHALSFAPTYLPLHIQMGDILINEGRIQEAIEKYQQVARLYALRGETPQAVRLITRVSRLAPMEISVRKSLIDLLRSSGNYEEMVQQYIDLANTHYLLADLDEARNSYHDALVLSQQVYSTRDQSIRILKAMADIELQSLNFKEAAKIFEQLRSLQPLNSSFRLALIDLYFRLSMPDAATNEVEAYLKFLDSEKKPQIAETFLDDLLNEKPDNAELRKKMTAYYIAHGETMTAVAKLDALAEKLLEDRNVAGSTSVISEILALAPPNRAEYEKLYSELQTR